MEQGWGAGDSDSRIGGRHETGASESLWSKKHQQLPSERQASVVLDRGNPETPTQCAKPEP